MVSVLSIYQNIAQITDAMLSAARADDWANVMEYGQQYCETVERLREVEPNEPPLNAAGRTIKYDLLVHILDNDAAVRDLAMPQLKSLGEMLGRMRRQQTVLLAYQGRASNM
jgi:flagellar protein FliT